MDQIDNYIIKLLQNKISETEYLELQDWLSEDEEHHLYYENFMRVYNSHKMFSIQENIHNSWNKLESKIKQEKEIKKTKPRVIRILARYLPYAAILILVASVFLNLYLGSIVSENSSLQAAYNEFSVPAGSRTAELYLSDGSKVMLNPGSSIKYPNVFNSKIREVTLEGEAFFDVAPNEKLPFIVTSGAQKVRVLGTSFIIDAYEELDYIKTTLITGEVELSFASDETQILRPHESCIYNKTDNTYQLIKKEMFNPSLVAKDIYKFKDARLKEICSKLNLLFDVTIILAPEIENDVYTGTISLKESILKALSLINYKHEFAITKIEPTVYELKKNN